MNLRDFLIASVVGLLLLAATYFAGFWLLLRPARVDVGDNASLFIYVLDDTPINRGLAWIYQPMVDWENALTTLQPATESSAQP